MIQGRQLKLDKIMMLIVILLNDWHGDALNN